MTSKSDKTSKSDETADAKKTEDVEDATADAKKTEDAEDATPEPASTVVLMRPKDGVPFEVFLVRRNSKSRFMANAYVYPGGRLDDTDCEVTLINHCRDYSPEDIADNMNVEIDVARGLYVAAIRETFEESGAMLFKEADGERVDLKNPDELDRWGLYREALIDEEVSFDQVIGWEDMLVSFETLVYFAHWITPEIEKHRYDTRFFLARAPDDQHLIHDDCETTDSIWITPAKALEKYDRGKLHLAPPTIVTLWQLSHFHSIDHALDYYRDRPVTTVRPLAQAENGSLVLMLPGDPEYPETVERSVEGPTRVVLESGLWSVIVTEDTEFPMPPIEKEEEEPPDEEDDEVKADGELEEGDEVAESDEPEDEDDEPKQFEV